MRVSGEPAPQADNWRENCGECMVVLIYLTIHVRLLSLLSLVTHSITVVGWGGHGWSIIVIYDRHPVPGSCLATLFTVYDVRA